MCSVMLDVGWINQGNEDIDVEKKPAHGNSSRSCCTNSEVIRGVSSLVGKRGTPLRVFRPEFAGRNALRASKEITSPTLFLCVAANSLAAASTSSSIARVVRISKPPASRINHHTSIDFRMSGKHRSRGKEVLVFINKVKQVVWNRHSA
jgi:hypothetical protein